jgi:4-oxalocrotonate tautomerase
MTAQSRSGPERQEPLLYHDMLSPAELLDVRAEVRAFAERVVAPRARQIGDGPKSAEHFPLIRALTGAAVQSFEVRPDEVRVMLNELPLDHHGVAGVTFGEKAESDTASDAEIRHISGAQS